MKLNNFFVNAWLVLIDLSASTPTTFVDAFLLPRKPPPPPNKTPAHLPASSSSLRSCNLIVPTAESWLENLDDIRVFVDKQWNLFLWNDDYTTFPMYLRDKFAVDLAPSSVYCDTVGACGFSCQALNPDSSQHDKQMAYFVFEQIAGVDHLFKSMRIALQESASYIDGKIPALIRMYSAAPRIARQLQQKLDDRRRNEKLGMSIVSGLLLLAGGAVGVPGVLGLEETIVAPLINMVTSTYISIIGTINAVRRDPEHLTDDLEENMRASFNEFRHVSMTNVTHDMKTFMEGDMNNVGQDLPSILQGEYFFRRDENIQEQILDSTEEMMYHTVVNALWGWDRSYIVWADAPPGGCQYDGRGPLENRACLPEEPESVYYVYALDMSREHDNHHNDKALIHGPTGYRNFFPGQNSDTYGATKEDIVRSSKFVHDNNLQDAIPKGDYKTFQSALTRGKNLGKNKDKLTGAYTLPICRNPGGEAISSVWSKHGRNYPCMCGEFGWKDNTWSIEKDETFNFLVRTGLMFSEDWEDFCHHEGHCKEEKSIDWHSELDALRKPGDPEIPKGLKHPFKKCKQKTKHRVGEPHHDFDANPPLG